MRAWQAVVLWLGACLLAVAVSVFAQDAPVFDELDQARLEKVLLAQGYAQRECQNLASVKQYDTIRAAVQKQIEARHAGYTVDWSTVTLVKAKQ